MPNVAELHRRLMRGSFVLKQANGTGPACWGLGDIFFLEHIKDVKHLHETEEFAKDLCAECPLLYTCREYALEANEEFGIWGGLTARDRKTYQNLP